MRRVLFALAAIGGLAALADAIGQAKARPHTLWGQASACPSCPSVTPEQLAQWIHDGKPGLRILDGRSKAAFDWYHIPGAERAASGAILVIADGRELELRGGMQAWLDMLQRPGALSRYFGGPPRRGGC